MNWLITGGCGFIGTGLIRRLKAEGTHAVRVIDNLSVGTREDLGAVASFAERTAAEITPSFSPNKVELVVGDILDEPLALKVTQGIDVIVHLAANTGVQPSIENPRKDCLTNVMGTLNYLEAARHNNVKRFVFASSGGTVIGDCEPPINENMVPHPKAPYGASKSACEGYCSAYYGSFGIETVALRFGNVYGPGSNHKGSVVAKFIRRALEEKPLEIYGDGKQTRDFIYIDDLTEAVTLAATRPKVGGEVFQIATSQETTVNEIAEALSSLIQEAGVTPVEIRHAQPLPGEIQRNYSDTRKAHELLGWQAKTSLPQGLETTLDWFRRGKTGQS